MKNVFKKLLLITSLIILGVSTTNAYAQNNNSDIKFATYFTGIGCPHCAIASPFIKKVLDEDPNFIVIEYELYKQTENAKLISQYHDKYDLGLGIPVVLFNKDNIVVGDSNIKNNLKLYISQQNSNELQTSDGIINLEDFTLDQINGYPKIYRQNRVAIREENNQLSNDQNNEIISFLTSDLSSWTSQKQEGEIVNPEIVEYPGGSVTYQHAIRVNGWILQWNGDIVQTKPILNPGQSPEYCEQEEQNVCPETVSIPKILGLALADSINPCAISVLLLMLIAITTYNPKDRKQILFSAGAFILAVIVMYMIYGFLIIKAFQFLQSITLIKTYLYKGLGIIALILGILEIKDYLKYKPGSVGTEMPLFLRPKVQNIISKITSPIGAFALGLFVTLFLLPCTIGPYVILGGMLSTMDYLNASPYLLIYNLIFVLPMIAISLVVFFGTKKIKDISNWKDKNVRIFHLVSGILMTILAVIMIFGLL